MIEPKLGKMNTAQMILTLACSMMIGLWSKGADALTLDEICIRSPYILADSASKKYYLYAELTNRRPETSERGVEVYVSDDLINWSQPKTVYAVPDGFWARYAVWSPEVHYFNNKYYLMVTLTSEALLDNPPVIDEKKWPALNQRGIHILVADSPLGPFKHRQKKPHTPESQMALDGTLFFEDGKPYMVYCHEWVQVKDGAMKFIQLNEDLSGTVGEPQLMFKGSDAPWPKRKKRFVTDGPCLYKMKNGQLAMLWSGDGGKYVVGLSISESGKLAGPWTHRKDLFYSNNGGQASMFETFDGKKVVILHQPNRRTKERARLLTFDENDEIISVKGQYQPAVERKVRAEN